MKVVYIAEKQNVGNVIAEHFWKGDAKKYKSGNCYKGKYKGDEMVVTWAHGHILADAMPRDYDPSIGTFGYPIIPASNEWKQIPDPRTLNLLNTIKKEISDADVVVNGGDPDREGQLLVDEILVYLGYKGNTRRIMIDGWDEVNVSRAFEKEDDNNLPVHRNMYASGLARKRADWLVGMNFSRAYTKAAKDNGFREFLRIGRVKSWLLGMVVRREREIKDFRSKKFFMLDGTFIKNNMKFTARYVPSDDILDPEKRVLEENAPVLYNLVKTLQGKPVTVTKIEEKLGEESPPPPYSLDLLQVEASRKLGLSPQEVLDEVQKLYESKYVTYPRSDCRFLPTAQHGDGKTILANLASIGMKEAEGADPTIKGKCFNDKKITAHHAIVPTMVKAGSLSGMQQKVYEMIALRYVLQFYPPAKIKRVTFELMVDGSLFKGSGSTVVFEGYRAVTGRGQDTDDNKKDGTEEKNNAVLPPLVKNEQLAPGEYEVNTGDTKPPDYFTESSIIKMMTDIWRYVDKKDEIVIGKEKKNLREMLKECNGIGTPATRGTILEELKQTERQIIDKDGKPAKIPMTPYIEIKNKKLYSTEFGKQVVSSLTPTLLDTSFTARMEFNLQRIAEGDYDIDEYIDTIIEFINEGINYAENSPSKIMPTSIEGGTDNVSTEMCPLCGKAHLRKITFKDKDGKPWDKPVWVCMSKSCKEENGFVFYWGDKKPTLVKCPECGRILQGVRMKDGTKRWMCRHGKTDITEGVLFLDDKKGKPVMPVECPVCGGMLRRVHLKSGGVKWVCDHGKDEQYGGPLWLDEDSKGNPIMPVKCPVCGGLLKRITSKKTGSLWWVCDHGKDEAKYGKPSFYADNNGKPLFPAACPVCKKPLRRVTLKKDGTVKWVCDHGKDEKFGKVLWLDDVNGKPDLKSFKG